MNCYVHDLHLVRLEAIELIKAKSAEEPDMILNLCDKFTPEG